MYILYSAAASLALVLSAPWWIGRMLRHGKYRVGIAERLGRVPERIRRPATAGSTASSPEERCIWIHAVSVGEVLAMGGIIAQLRQRFPCRRIVVSTTTLAGQMLARQRFGEENVFYFPLDFTLAIRPYLQTLRPELIVLAETEFWPNFLRLAKRSGARIAAINARISDRSLPRYRRCRGLMKSVLANIDVFLAQSEEDRRRLVEIGVVPDRVQVSGNLKFGVKPPASLPVVAELRSALARGHASHVLVCGSTLPGEEEMLLGAFGEILRQHPTAVLVLAPRHPEGFDAVADLLRSTGVNSWRRTELAPDAALGGGVLLLDTIGELGAVYGLASLAFVGGSLVPAGGHNMVEPAQHGVAVLAGPHTENFRDIVNIFRRAEALRVVHPDTLTATLLELLGNQTECQELGRRAAAVVAEQSGSTERTLTVLTAMLTPGDVATAEDAPVLPTGRAVGDAGATR